MESHLSIWLFPSLQRQWALCVEQSNMLGSIYWMQQDLSFECCPGINALISFVSMFALKCLGLVGAKRDLSAALEGTVLC